MATLLEVAVSVTDTEVFQEVLELLGDVYQNTTDELVREKIEQDLNKILGKKMDVKWLPNDHYDPVDG